MSGRLSDKRICVTGGAGFLGRAVCEALGQEGVERAFVPRRAEYDLTRAANVERMFDDASPEIVIHLAAEVGGIGANALHPGRFFYANMAMGLNLIEGARRRGVEKFVQVGTVCSYPKFAETPFRESQLWDGYPEETNAPYGVAKRALAVMLEAYQREYGLESAYLILANLYGPRDNFDPETSHVIPALIRKFTEAAATNAPFVTCWGSGQVTREFLYVEDAAEAIERATVAHSDPAPLNIGTGVEITIADLASRIAALCGYCGEIRWDASRPDGQPRRRLDTSLAERVLGWRACTILDDGLRATIAWWRADRAGVTRDSSDESHKTPLPASSETPANAP